MLKDTAGQKIDFFAFNYATGAPKTGDAANLHASYQIDDGQVLPLIDTQASEVSGASSPGWYKFDLQKAETNGTKILFTCISDTPNVTVVGQTIYTESPVPPSGGGGGATSKSGLFRSKYWNAGHFDGSMYQGIQELGVSCDGVFYANRSDIELIFGASNVSKWADVDNNGIVDNISNRVCWALQNAQADIDNRLLGGPYAVPFILPYPRQIITTTARLAGVMLYDSRGVTDFSELGNPLHQLHYHKSMVEKVLSGILSRSIRLTGCKDIATTHPATVESV